MAFGKSEEDEPFKNAHVFGSHVRGQVGLLFTNQTKKQIVEFFQNVKVEQYANPGQISVVNVELMPGLEALKGIPTSNDTYLRKLGLPIEVLDARLVLTKNFVIAMKGKPLTIEQSRILKFLGVKLSQMILRPTACYDKKTGKVEEISF